MRIKLVVVGSNAAVKRNLLMNFKEQTTQRDYLPLVIDNFLHSSKRCEATIWDTSGSENYYQSRQLSYPETSVFLLTYSNSDADSFAAVASYYEEISSACPCAAIILVAVDMHEKGNNKISAEDGRELAIELGAPFLECDIKDLNDVNLVFQSAMSQGLVAKTLARQQKLQRALQLWQAPAKEESSAQEPKRRLTHSL